MFPPETSLIPVTIALARFVEANGLTSMFGWYPHWYLGVPFQYLTGPIIPLLQVIFHKIFPALSLFEITYALLFLSYLASILGWGMLAKKISGKRFIGIVVGVLLVILPWRLYSALALREASGVMAENLLPYVFIAFWYFYKNRGRRYAIYSILALSTLLLISTSAFTVFLVGISGLILSSSYKMMRAKKISVNFKPTLLTILVSLFVVTLWYGLGYWITVIANPSIGGPLVSKHFYAFLTYFELRFH